MAGVVTQGRQSLPEETRGDYGVAHVPNLLWRGKKQNWQTIEWGKIASVSVKLPCWYHNIKHSFCSLTCWLFVLLSTMQCAMAQGQQAGGTHSGLTYLDRIAQCYNSLLSGMWNIDDQHRNTDMNDKDHLVGQLTTPLPTHTHIFFSGQSSSMQYI